MLGHHSAIAWLVTGVHAAGLSESLLELLVAIGDEPVESRAAFVSGFAEAVARRREMLSHVRLESIFKLQIRIGLRGFVKQVVPLGFYVGAIKLKVSLVG